MKIKRFVAQDMRSAIRQVREEQGPDAVILSNRRVAEGVEVVAATDYDEALVQQAARRAEVAPETREPKATAPKAKPAEQAAAIAARVPAAETKSKILWAQDPAISQMRTELNNLRHSLESQLRGLSYDLISPSPHHAGAMQSLANIGLDPALARGLINHLPTNLDDQQLRARSMVALSQKLPVLRTDTILQGGCIALVGPTGVGKTTTLAKLAARYVAHRSSRDVALVSCDNYRVGAHDQIFAYGRLLGVSVHTLQGRETLSQLLDRLKDYRLILIDTAGFSPRDPRLSDHLAALDLKGRITTYLVLPASGQAQDLEEVADRYSALPLSGMIFTKIDETSRLGGVLSVAIRRNLQIAYLSDGQRVPEDLHQIEAHRLVIRALHAAWGTPKVINPEPELAHARI